MSDLIARALRTDFREFCVSYFVLREIDNIFAAFDVPKGVLSPGTVISGQRRQLVEQYYSSFDWSNPKDADRFLNVIQMALSQTSISNEVRKQFAMVLQREGYALDGARIRRLAQAEVSKVDPHMLLELEHKWIELSKEEAHRRGFLFEGLLKDIFSAFGLAPRKAFRIQGEQIDGSFQLGTDTYLLEAKWHMNPTPQADLLVFREKVESKSAWARGLFVSYSGFTQEGLAAFRSGRSTNIVGMDGQDIYFVLSGQMSLPEALARKVRHAAETGEFFAPIFNIMHE